MFGSYRPVQVNVFPPLTVCKPDVSTPRLTSKSVCSCGQSSPTTPTSCTSVKKLAAYEKCVAEPPNRPSRRAWGVSTLSMATEPTTSRGIGSDNLEQEPAR